MWSGSPFLFLALYTKHNMLKMNEKNVTNTAILFYLIGRPAPYMWLLSVEFSTSGNFLSDISYWKVSKVNKHFKTFQYLSNNVFIRSINFESSPISSEFVSILRSRTFRKVIRKCYWIVFGDVLKRIHFFLLLFNLDR